MPVKEWMRDLGDFRVFAELETEKGTVIRFKVLLLALIAEEWECVTRYDCHHGFAHQDILGKKAGQRWKELPSGISLDQYFEYAKRDCEKNCEEYLEDYLSH